MIPLPQAQSLKIEHIGIGVFDGVHRGHQEIIATVLKQSSDPQSCALLTFDPHPLEVISPEKAPSRLGSTRRMHYWIQQFGIPHLLLIPFDQKVRHLSPVEFMIWLKRYLPHLQSITVGFNWRFGFNGLGSTLTLVDLGSQLNFSTHIVPPLLIDELPASSTRIREALSQKKFSFVEKLLGHPFEVVGTVIPGDGKGKTIGFPTANLETARLQLPPFGVYGCRVLLRDKIYPAVVNYGIRPTFHKSKPQIEAHLIGFEGDLYNQELILQNWQWIRDEKKFSSEQELRAQIESDIASIKLS